MKPKRTMKVRDQVAASYPAKKRVELARATKSPPASASAEPPILGESQRLKFNYSTGFTVVSDYAEEPLALAVLGGRGRIKLDLRTAGVRFHREAFAFTIPDESLCVFNVHRGDIAIIEPFSRAIREGDLVLVLLDGVETIRCIVYSGTIAYFSCGTTTGGKATLIPVWEYPLLGTVRSILRMFVDRFGVPSPAEQSSPMQDRLSPTSPAATSGFIQKSPLNRLQDEPGEYRSRRPRR